MPNFFVVNVVCCLVALSCLTNSYILTPLDERWQYQLELAPKNAAPVDDKKLENTFASQKPYITH